MGIAHKIDWQYGGYTGTLEYKCDDYSPECSDSQVLLGRAYWLFDGNGGCDCNRYGMMLSGSCQFPWKFQNVHNWEIDEDDWGCGDEIIFNHVEFWRDGRLIGYGRDDMVDYALHVVEAVPFPVGG